MEDSFKNMVYAFIFIGLFGMLILTVVIDVSNDYGVDNSEVIGGSLSITKFNNSIKDLQTNAETLKAEFEKQSIWSAVAGVVVEGIFGVALNMFKLILSTFDIIFDISLDIFGVPSWFTSVLMAILILSVIFSVWRILKVGD